MSDFSMEPTWQIILNIAKTLNKDRFSLEDIVKKIRDNGLLITESTVRSHLIGMSPNHPSSIHKPFLRQSHPVFRYLGNGYYKLVGVDDEISDKISSLKQYVNSHIITIDSSPMINDPKRLGDFYIVISYFEKELREVIKNKFGKGMYKILKKELPLMIQEWEERKKTDEYWGIQTETELINYALLTDYMKIINKYKKKFSVGGDEEINTVIAQLKQFATYGRNPIMHCRTLSEQKYYTTISCVNSLKTWIKRIR